jgi:hypothetical protein
MCITGLLIVIGIWLGIVFIPYIIGVLTSKLSIGCEEGENIFIKWLFGIIHLALACAIGVILFLIIYGTIELYNYICMF